MNTSIKTVLLLGFFGASSTLGACGGYVNLGDPSAAGAGGEGDGAGGSEDTGAGAGSGATSASGGTAGTTGGGSAEAGAGGGGSTADPYAPRSGPFKMLVYSRTMAFRHEDSIKAGKQMLAEIAAERGFDVTMTETNEEFTPQGLAQYEVVFFLNTTGDVLNQAEEQAFEAWMTTQNGAFAGVHSATDTEINWPFYKEVTGQYFDLHGPSGTPGDILLEVAASDFPGMAGLPNPWSRIEEWFRFNQHEVWSAKPGFTILARHAADDNPVSWTREFSNFRSFYTSLGHDPVTYSDELVKTHVAGGILWAVRREHLFEE